MAICTPAAWWRWPTPAAAMAPCASCRQAPRLHHLELKSNFFGSAREGVIVCVAGRCRKAAPPRYGMRRHTRGREARPIAQFRNTQLILWPKAMSRRARRRCAQLAGLSPALAGSAPPWRRRASCHPAAAVAAANFANESTMLTRPIPQSQEPLPVVGFGTWQTFDVGAERASSSSARRCLAVLLEAGGKVIDSSPMYGRAEAVVGTC